MVPSINNGLEKWVNIRACDASLSVIIFLSYIILIFLALEGNPDKIDKKNIVIILSLTLNNLVNIFFIAFGI